VPTGIGISLCTLCRFIEAFIRRSEFQQKRIGSRIADGIFVPGLTDLVLIEKFALLTPLPVNIMVTQGVPEIPDLARVGVRRVSLGPWPMMTAMRVIEQAAAAVAASKQYGTFLQPKA
jgi:2-methylisocitrate lyase-like PEP mutase family enzyme